MVLGLLPPRASIYQLQGTHPNTQVAASPRNKGTSPTGASDLYDNIKLKMKVKICRHYSDDH